MRRKVVGILVVLVLATAAGAFWWNHHRRAEAAELELSGTIEADDIAVGSTLGGRVLEVLVEEGTPVTEGQPLVRFDPEPADLDVAEARAAVAETKAALAKVEAGPRDEERKRAEIALAAAETQHRRYAALYGQGLVSKEQLDGTAVAEATAKEQALQLRRGSRAEDVAAARASVDRARERLAQAERRRKETEVAAPHAALVQSVAVRPGDLVPPGGTVATLLETDRLRARIYVPETKLGGIRVGATLPITVDSFPGRTFPGRVIEIAPRGEYIPRNVQTLEQRADQMFGVLVRLDSPELRPGMAAMTRLPAR